jgi:hypothetical protein
MTSLSRNARIAGLLYLTLLTAPLRLIYIPSKLFVAGNASATANNIAAHETLFRLGIVSDLFTATMAIFLTLALYRLFKGVDQDLARLMVILGALMVTPIYFLNTINDAAALLLARGADFLSVFDKPQRDALVMVFLPMHGQGIFANSIFWGLWLFPFGLLVYRLLPTVRLVQKSGCAPSAHPLQALPVITGQSGWKYALRTLRLASRSRKGTGFTLGSWKLRLKIRIWRVYLTYSTHG